MVSMSVAVLVCRLGNGKGACCGFNIISCVGMSHANYQGACQSAK